MKQRHDVEIKANLLVKFNSLYPEQAYRCYGKDETVTVASKIIINYFKFYKKYKTG